MLQISQDSGIFYWKGPPKNKSTKCMFEYLYLMAWWQEPRSRKKLRSQTLAPLCRTPPQLDPEETHENTQTHNMKESSSVWDTKHNLWNTFFFYLHAKFSMLTQSAWISCLKSSKHTSLYLLQLFAVDGWIHFKSLKIKAAVKRLKQIDAGTCSTRMK